MTRRLLRGAIATLVFLWGPACGIAQALLPDSATIPAGPAGEDFESTGADISSHAWRVSVEGHFSVFSDAADHSTLGDSFGYGLQGGYQWKRLGLFFHVEQNLWLTAESAERRVVQGALNLGFGGDFRYFDNRMESSLVVGPSVLLFDTALDDAPAVGLFAEARFTTIRFTLHRNWVIRLAPLTFAVVAPVLGGIPLIKVEFRTVLTFEFRTTSKRGAR